MFQRNGEREQRMMPPSARVSVRKCDVGYDADTESEVSRIAEYHAVIVAFRLTIAWYETAASEFWRMVRNVLASDTDRKQLDDLDNEW